MNGEISGALAGKDARDTKVLTTCLGTLVNQYGLVERQLPVFSDSTSRNARYYIADNFLQGWLAVARSARDVARLKPRDASRNIEIDVVALDADTKTVRFGSCKRSSSSHTPGALAQFDRHVAAFLQTREGRRVPGWNLRKVCFSPRFASEERAALMARGYDTLDLLDYARLF